MTRSFSIISLSASTSRSEAPQALPRNEHAQAVTGREAVEGESYIFPGRDASRLCIQHQLSSLSAFPSAHSEKLLQTEGVPVLLCIYSSK